MPEASEILCPDTLFQSQCTFPITTKVKKKKKKKKAKHKLQKNGKMKIRQIETKMKENTHMHPNETNID